MYNKYLKIFLFQSLTLTTFLCVFRLYSANIILNIDEVTNAVYLQNNNNNKHIFLMKFSYVSKSEIVTSEIGQNVSKEGQYCITYGSGEFSHDVIVDNYNVLEQEITNKPKIQELMEYADSKHIPLVFRLLKHSMDLSVCKIFNDVMVNFINPSSITLSSKLILNSPIIAFKSSIVDLNSIIMHPRTNILTITSNDDDSILKSVSVFFTEDKNIFRYIDGKFNLKLGIINGLLDGEYASILGAEKIVVVGRDNKIKLIDSLISCFKVNDK